jgi:hypothetical protein
MLIKNLFLGICILVAGQVVSLEKVPLTEHFKQVGYLEISDRKQDPATFDQLYKYFDEFIEFLQSNPAWANKLYIAKERFIRSQARHYYSTDFFGFYDESERRARRQIAFYYSIHFHKFIGAHYAEFAQVPQIMRFLDACLQIQKPYGALFDEIATALGLEKIFCSKYGQPPVLFKVVKYLPAHITTRPHYDGTAFSLFLDNTDHQSLLLSPYKSSFAIQDFAPAVSKFFPKYSRYSIFLIPGTFLTEFAIYPTPHIVAPSGKTRYATIAFAMRPHYDSAPQTALSFLPNFKSLEEFASNQYAAKK